MWHLNSELLEIKSELWNKESPKSTSFIVLLHGGKRLPYVLYKISIQSTWDFLFSHA